MSITGTIVLDQKDGKDVSTTEYSGYRIKLEDLIADTTSKPVRYNRERWLFKDATDTNSKLF